MASEPTFKEWDTRKFHHIYPEIGKGDLSWQDMEAVACTDPRLLALVRQARASAGPLESFDSAWM
jgi:hypothetical protein